MSAARILAGLLLFKAPPPSPADRDSNRRPKSPRPAALAFDGCLFRQQLSSPMLAAESATEKNPNCVFLSACLLACLPK